MAAAANAKTPANLLAKLLAPLPTKNARTLKIAAESDLFHPLKAHYKIEFINSRYIKAVTKHFVTALKSIK